MGEDIKMFLSVFIFIIILMGMIALLV